MQMEIYLDANATTPVLPAAAERAAHTMHALFGNPSSTHIAGLQARDMKESVRRRAAAMLGAGDGKLLFVSGATEAIQTAVLSALCATRSRRQAGNDAGHLLLYGATEHKAVPESLAHWNKVLDLKLELRALPVGVDGRHDLAVLRQLAPEAAMVCTMAANNETGVTSDLAAIEHVLEETASPALWLVDCVQALGKMPLDLSAIRIDYAAFSGHKLYAPKGIGLLYLRDEAPFTPLMAGGGQEGGHRSGTENMVGLAAFGAVLEALEDGTSFRTHQELAGFRDQMVESLRCALPGIVFNAPFSMALPTTLNFSVPGSSSKELLDLFDAAGIRVSSGSACSSAPAVPSFVLEAMGLPLWRAAAAIRMSFGPAADAPFVALACERIRRCGDALRTSKRTAGSATFDRGVIDERAIDCDRQLSGRTLNAFLDEHADAILIDVREPFEHLVGPVRWCLGREPINVPMSRLVEHTDAWLHDKERPLLFICRSGNRSGRAAAYLQLAGHPQAWHLSGGLALASHKTDATAIEFLTTTP